jgi:hypothetical protein
MGQAHPESDEDNNNGKDNAALDMRPIRDWTLLPGVNVEIRQQGTTVCSGYVDAVTDDGKIIWVISLGQNRRLYEKDEFYEAWATEDSCGFHYKVAADAGPGMP